MTGAAALLLAGCSGQSVDEGASPAETAETVRPAPTLEETARAEADTRQQAREPRIPALSSIAEPRLTSVPVTDTMDVLMGPGGNVAVLYGEEGALLVDDKFAEDADEILARVGQRGDALPLYVLNTHYHGDHTGSNARMKAVGALVVAQEGARDLITRDIENELFGRTVEARPQDAPQLTFTEGMTLDFAGETVRLIHVPNAHTGGDSLIHFEGSDVLHMGDNFFNGMFPYIDIDSGGSLEGMIAAQGTGVRLSDADTVVIPGHGPITDRSGLEESYDRLVDIRDRMQARIDAGDTLEEVLEADIYADYGMDGGFINNERMARIAYRSLSESQP